MLKKTRGVNRQRNFMRPGHIRRPVRQPGQSFARLLDADLPPLKTTQALIKNRGRRQGIVKRDLAHLLKPDFGKVEHRAQ